MTSPDANAPSISRLRVPDEEELPENLRTLFAGVREDDGFVRNYFRAHALNPRNFSRAITYLLGLLDPDEGQLSLRERELIAVVVSAENRCAYCLASHAAELRGHTGDPALVERIVANYRQVELGDRERAIADLAVRITTESHLIAADELAALHGHGLDDAAVLEVVEIAAAFNYTNRLLNALAVVPDDAFFTANR